jgi:uncharacterized protein
MRISGSSVLLTGASGGLGQAIARTLAGHGAKLLLSGRGGEVLDSLAGELGGTALPADLSDAEQTRRLAQEAGEVDILIANAGLPGSGLLQTYEIEQIGRVLDVNLRAPIVLARELTPGMVVRKRGHVVFMSSLAGKAASPGSSLYNATKFGLRGFSTALRAELRGTGVGVSTILPGFVRDAGMFADAKVSLPPGIGTSTPAEVARAVVRAIEHDRGEVGVAPLHLRAGAAIAGLVPELSMRVQTRAGGGVIADKMAKGQRDKR